MTVQTGDTVNYHSISGGEITSTGHVVVDYMPEPNNFGCDVVWITGKSGCVDVEHLTKVID